jgi:hypothetical protein
MKNSIKILGIVAGAIAAATIITRKRADGTSLFDDIAEASKDWGNKLVDYSTRLKEKMTTDTKGPDGESVFSDMYDRQYYMDDTSKKLYTDV